LFPLACLLTPALRFLASEPAPQTTKEGVHTEQGKAVPTVQKATWWQGFAQVSPPFSHAQLLPLHIQSAGCLSNEKLSSACHLWTTYFCLAAPWMRWAALVWCSMTLARAALRRSSAPRIDSLRVSTSIRIHKLLHETCKRQTRRSSDAGSTGAKTRSPHRV
jgi:hypothetical protein